MTSKNGSCDNARPSYADLWKAPYADPWLSTK
jgi:hypothetical protein